MANRAYLYNTENLVRNPYHVRERDPGVGRFVEVAEQARWLPIPWMLAFRPEDAHPFKHVWVEDEEDPSSERKPFAGFVLSAPLARVLENLRASLPVMEKVVGDPRLARAYLDDAVRAFSTLELPYVLLDAEEVVDGQYERYVDALDGSARAVGLLRDWASYSEEAFPLEPDEPVPLERDENGLYCGFGPGPTEEEREEERQWNTREESRLASLRRKADAGDPEAQVALAEKLEGAAARELLERAAKAGHAGAQARLAADYSMDGNHRLAMAWLTRAAESGHADSAAILGRILQGTQPGVIDLTAQRYAGPGERAPEPAKSYYWLRKAADAGLGNPMTWLQLGEMTFYGAGPPQDHEAAARWFRLAADAGHDKAQLWMAILSYHGFGVKQDRVAAARWTRRSAEQGAAGAQLAMGILYAQGHGVPKDPKASRQWAEKAAAQGFELADTFLATPAWKFWARRGFFTGLQ